MLKYLKAFWDFLWNDDSTLSWVLNIVVAFLLIKFVVYPGLGFVFGTQYPIVAVVSGSMEHDGDFDQWWASPALCPEVCTQERFYAEYGIDKASFREFKYPNGFDTGDIMVLVGTPPKYLEPGDVVVFFIAKGEPIIHRLIKAEETEQGRIFQTKGDHNTNSIATPGLNEVHIPESVIIGKAVLRVPYLGWIKILFFEAISKVGQLVGVVI